VFEEAADDAAKADVFAEAFHTGNEAAGGADDEVDFLHAGLRGGVEVVDGDLIDELVHLGDDARGFAGGGVGGFAGDELLDAGVEIEGRDEETLELGRAAGAGEGVEKLRDFFGERFVGGEEGKVGVETRGFGIVVAGAEVDVALHRAVFAADDEAAFAMGFVADEAVDDVDAGFLHLARPVDVVGFVEAGFQFDERGDLFAVERRVHERADDGGVAAGAIERLLDREDLGIACGLLDEIDDGREGVVGMVEEDFAFADGVENRDVRAEARDVGGGERRVFEVRAIDDVVETHQTQEVDGRRNAEGEFARELEVSAEKSEEVFVDAVLDLEADGGAAAEIAELFLDFFEEVFGFLLVDVEVAVACDAKGVRAVDPVSGKQRHGEALDDFAEENVAVGAVGVGIELDDAREDSRDGKDDDGLFDLRRFGIVEGEEDVEGFVDDLGERMGLIDGERGEDGRDLGVEVVLGPGRFGFGELGGGAEVDVLFREEGNELLVPAAVLVVDEVVGGGADALELFAGRKAVEAEFGGAGVGLLDEAGDADLEELVEVGTDDREEFDAFEERIGVALGLLEDAAIEVEPALFAVGVDGAVLGRGGARDGFAGGAGNARLARTFRGGLGHARSDVARSEELRAD
jgi:hypothetical protein